MSIGTADRDKLLRSLVKEADQAILLEAEENSDLEGMGTTITGAILSDGIAYWVHVGDSRMYLLRDGGLNQVTRDQNWAQFLVDEGEISAEEAQSHVLGNLLDQCVGCGECEPETGHLEIRKGDILMLSTDGLHDEVSRDAISRILISRNDIKNKAKTLIDAALEGGGKDNITVVLVEV
ncbi:MAG: serine/threonine-protein phosphatase [Deltaproteobacteria bacterium]|nr:serine/threonine-protein phosphatase [Deltaproteobacteria bacterium]